MITKLAVAQILGDGTRGRNRMFATLQPLPVCGWPPGERGQ
jgi:hypothetical protein